MLLDWGQYVHYERQARDEDSRGIEHKVEEIDG